MLQWQHPIGGAYSDNVCGTDICSGRFSSHRGRLLWICLMAPCEGLTLVPCGDACCYDICMYLTATLDSCPVCHANMTVVMYIFILAYRWLLNTDTCGGQLTITLRLICFIVTEMYVCTCFDTWCIDCSEVSQDSASNCCWMFTRGHLMQFICFLTLMRIYKLRFLSHQLD